MDEFSEAARTKPVVACSPMGGGTTCRPDRRRMVAAAYLPCRSRLDPGAGLLARLAVLEGADEARAFLCGLDHCPCNRRHDRALGHAERQCRTCVRCPALCRPDLPRPAGS